MILIITVLCSLCILVPHEINEYYPDIVIQNAHWSLYKSMLVGIVYVVDVDAVHPQLDPVAGVDIHVYDI